MRRRTKSRRSSLTAAVPYAPLRTLADCTQHRPRPEQLALAIDMPAHGPALAATIEAADAARGAGIQPFTPENQLAKLGEVLARVLDFHEAFDLPREPLPTVHVGDALAQLRVRLLREEVEEFADAAERRDLVAIADALADVVYVAYGSAVTYGIDLDAVVREVHRSNMSKLDDNGRPVMRQDGKVMKSQRYRPPNVGGVIGEQLPLFDPVGPAQGTAGARPNTVAAG